MRSLRPRRWPSAEPSQELPTSRVGEIHVCCWWAMGFQRNPNWQGYLALNTKAIMTWAARHYWVLPGCYKVTLGTYDSIHHSWKRPLWAQTKIDSTGEHPSKWLQHHRTCSCCPSLHPHPRAYVGTCGLFTEQGKHKTGVWLNCTVGWHWQRWVAVILRH